MSKHPAYFKRLIANGALVAMTAITAGCATSVSPYGGSSSFACNDKGSDCVSISDRAEQVADGELDWKKETGKEAGTGDANSAKEKRADQSIDEVTSAAHGIPLSPTSSPAASAAAPTVTISPRGFEPPFSGMPIRVPEQVVRIWFAPYEDTDGSLNDQRYVYVAVVPAAWNIQSTRPANNNAYRTVRPLAGESKPQSANQQDSQVPTVREQARAEALGFAQQSKPAVPGNQD